MLLRFLLLSPLLVFGQSSLVSDWSKQMDTWGRLAPIVRLQNVKWSASGQKMVYAVADADGRMTWKYVDCGKGQVRLAYDQVKLIDQLSLVLNQRVSPRNLPFKYIEPLDDGRIILVGEKQSWTVEADGRLTPSKVLAVASTRPNVNSNRSRSSLSENFANSGKLSELSPDEKWKVSFWEGNVLLTEVTEPSHVLVMTSDGQATHRYVGPVSWSPDSTHFALWREQVAPPRMYNVVNSLTESSKNLPYPRPGDDISERTPLVFSVLKAEASVRPSLEVLPRSYENSRLDWTADSTRLRSQYTERGFTGHGVIEYDVTTKQWRTLLNEHDPKFVFTSGSRFRYDIDDNSTLWASERTGFLHLYHVDLRSGATLNAVTAGNWVMKQVKYVDTKAQEVGFIALGRQPSENPYHQHFCKAPFNGSKVIDLTPGDADHSVEFEPNRRYLIDTASRVNQPPVITLRSGENGRAIVQLEAATVAPLAKTSWQPLIPFRTKDREGKYDIWGVILRPYPFDPQKKYPVLERIYAGPHGSFAPYNFNLINRSFYEASLSGFYVVQLDGRGTYNRGKEFQQQIWRNLKDGGFPDRIKWIKAAAQVEKNMDISRVGIFGGSAGGQNTAHAMLLFGDFYKAGAADCGCYDNRIDKLWWNEQWLGYPLGPWYSENSCATYASRLTGKLFLTVGESDTNVDVKCTYDFRDALLAAGKKELFQLQVVPGANHGAGETDSMREKRMQFFVDALGLPR